jgi:hypothetical protein
MAKTSVSGYGTADMRLKGGGKKSASNVYAMKKAPTPKSATCPKFRSDARPSCRSNDIARSPKIII